MMYDSNAGLETGFDLYATIFTSVASGKVGLGERRGAIGDQRSPIGSERGVSRTMVERARSAHAYIHSLV